VRCDNEHFVPAGFSYCRRCVDEPVSAPAASIAYLTLGGYTEQRDRLAPVGVSVVAGCLVALVGGSVTALAPAIVAGIVVLLATRVALGMRRRPAMPAAPASAREQKLLDRLVITPAIAVVVTVVVAFLSW
jgi:hypothetical protein